MKIKALRGCLLGLAVWACWAAGTAFAFEDGYGDISGQFVLDGAVPAPKLLVKKGDAAAKDPTVCAAENVPDESIVVDPDSKGIANIFVFLRKAPKNVHPSLKASKEKEIVFDQKGCKFLPHGLFVRTDQTVLVKSMDTISHNTHTYPLRNTAVNLTIAPNERKGTAYVHKSPESNPIQVKCDIHPWMVAHWLILDHPYAAVTDKDGKFKIEKLPVGEHEFMVWQESKGWVSAGTKRGFKVKVESGGSTDLGAIKLTAADLSDGK